MYLAICIFISWSGTLAIVDDRVHYFQIDLFDHGDLRVADALLTVLPGYHALVASVLWLLNLRSLEAARLLNAVFGLLTVGAFYLTRQRVNARDASSATLQYAFLPILFPFDFLVYTDVLSLGLVLAATSATLRARHVLAGTLLLAAMLVRQVDVIWLPLLAALTLWQHDDSPKIPMLTHALRRTWPYAIGIGLFVAYWICNGSISLSKEQTVMHPDWSIHLDNIYFSLFLCGLFPPLQVIAGPKRCVAHISRRPWLARLPVAGVTLYWLTFHIDHPCNQVTDPFTLHNALLQFCQTHVLAKVAVGIVAVLAACGLADTALQPRGSWAFYPIAAVALAAFWMIEPRYTLLPLSLWLALRTREKDSIENATMALWAIMAVCLCLGMFVSHTGM